MAVSVKSKDEPRWVRTLRAPETLADDLGFCGSWVGPRTGPDKRDHGQKEDYVLRRVLVAWREAGVIEFPVDIRAETDRAGEPDFLLSLPDSSTLGLEVTEAGDRTYQAWLTRTEAKTMADAGDAVLMPGDGVVNRVETQEVANQILKRIRDKVSAYDEKESYRTPDVCDLAVYDNTSGGGFLDKRVILQEVRRANDAPGRFRQIHLVFGETIVLDAFGSEPRFVDVSRTYEIDYANWIADQVEKLRRHRGEGIDWEHIAEELESLGRSERRALRSHLENLILHLLKWEYQPERRGRSWGYSIRNSRREVYEILTEEPSLKPTLPDSITTAFTKARLTAAAEMDISDSALPEQCPYSDRQLVDPEFLPGPPGEGGDDEHA